MQIQGDIKKFTNTIDAAFEKKLTEVKATHESTFSDAKAKNQTAQSEIKKAFTQQLKRDVELISKKETSNAICEARTAFDEKKTELFETILTDIAGDAKSVAGKEYKDSVKSAVSELSSADAKKATLIVSAKALVPSSFTGKVEITKDFIGAKVISGASVIDLSLETVLETKKASVSVLLHNALFE